VDSPAYLPLLQVFGWLTVLMFAAVWVGLPGGPERRHAGWLLAFAAARLVSGATDFVLAGPPEWQQFAAIVSGMLLWEFARRTWNHGRRRAIPATTHLVAGEALLLVSAAALAGTTTADWLIPLDFFAAVLPGLLGGGAMLLLWFSDAAETGPSARVFFRSTAIGLGLFGLAHAVAGEAWGLLPPWLATAGLGATCLAVAELRSTASLAFGLGLALSGLLGPTAVSWQGTQIGFAEVQDLISRVQSAAAPLRGEFSAQLSGLSTSRPTQEIVRASLEKIRRDDPLLRQASLWRVVGTRIEIADPVAPTFVDVRPARPEELEGISHARPFALPADSASGHPFAVALAPLTSAKFENPAAWLALEYPGIFWETQRRQARQVGTALAGLLATFCAMGFVLAARQRLEAARQIQVQRLQAADKAKTEFLAFLSHELRTPLQTILGRTALLRAEQGAGSLRHADALESQGRLLLRLVTDLLDLGTIEAGALRLHPASFSLRRLLAALEDAFAPLAAAQHLALAISLPPDLPDLWIGDEARLRQVLGNLLGNGIKYTSHGSVSLRVRADSLSLDRARLTFHVVDTGPGLPPEKIPALFTLFTRLDDGTTFSREGTGIGLALVRRLCTLMGGTVSAANRPEGGAEFTVSVDLPLASEPLSSPPSPEEKIPGRRSVLVVEDNTAAREFLVEALRSLGHEAEAVVEGSAALGLLDRRASAFNVVLLDVNLPGQDGVALARRLRTEHPHLRLVGCSAEAFPQVRAAALAAGMNEFLVKPVTLDALARAISPDPSSVGTHLFAKLQSPAMAARARSLLAQEWPRLRAETESALARAEPNAPHRLAHYLKASALLLEDAELLQLCRDLSDPSQATSTTLDRIALHLAEPLARVG
jgi:signal transduction histidine kinase/CheY-like chemotaxis protein